MSTYGNLKYDFTFPASNPSGSLVLIKSITASASSSISFVDGSNGVVLDSTYKAYKFVFKNIHPANNDINFNYNGSTDGGSNYNVTKTTTFFEARHREDDTSTSLVYSPGFDLAQSTADQRIINGLGNASDGNGSGELWLFNPSSTTYVKHFMSRLSSMNYQATPFSQDTFVAGYFNTTSAVDAVRFQMSIGNIDDGTISLYGLA